MADKGEGSRGGKIVGHYKSGRPMYEIGGTKRAAATAVGAGVAITAASAAHYAKTKIPKAQSLIRTAKTIQSRQLFAPAHDASITAAITRNSRKVSGLKKMHGFGSGVAAIATGFAVAGAASLALSALQKKNKG